jgi:radical SAM protein with 4Fe4S-binding SPASM domain
MVMPGRARRWGRTLLDVARRDLAGVRAAIRPVSGLQQGLFTYRVSPPGGSRTIHLRIEADGRGTLLIDVSDVVHLNATAASLAKMALDGLSPTQAAARIGQRYRGAGRRQIDRDVGELYDLIDHIKSTTNPCPTCGLKSTQRKDLFSTAVDAPYKADLALTYGCNNACGHCYNEQDRIDTRSLAPGQWKQVLDRLHAIGVPHVIFTGGEPTLHPDLVELVAHGRDLELVTGMNSNGRRYADRAFTAAVADAGLSHLQITLQSHRSEIHNAMTGATSFADTVRGVQNSLDAGLHTITNTTLTRRNSADAEQTVEFLHDLGLKAFAMNGMIHSGSGCGFDDAIPEDSLAPVLAAVRDRADELGMRFLWYTPTPYCRLSPVELGLGPRRCNAAEYTVAIEPDGSVLPCQSYYQPAGNILRDDWDEIWNSPLFRSFRGRIEAPQDFGLPEMCRQCPDLTLCGGGCRLAWEAEMENKLPILTL